MCFLLKEKPVKKDANQAAKIQDDEISSSSDLATTPVPSNLKEESEDEENGEDGNQHKFSFLKDKISDRKSCVIKSGGEKWFTNSQTEGGDIEPCNAYWLGKIEKYTRPPLDCNVTPMKTTSLATQHILIAAPSAVMFLENANYFFFC